MNRSKELRETIVKTLGAMCVRCGYSEDIRVLHVDHKEGNGWLERSVHRGASYYKFVAANLNSGNYQILCANCNIIKALDFDIGKRKDVLRQTKQKLYNTFAETKKENLSMAGRQILPLLPETIPNLVTLFSPIYTRKFIQDGIGWLIDTGLAKVQEDKLQRVSVSC
jgi:hypothetical protein